MYALHYKDRLVGFRFQIEDEIIDVSKKALDVETYTQLNELATAEGNIYTLRDNDGVAVINELHENNIVDEKTTSMPHLKKLHEHLKQEGYKNEVLYTHEDFAFIMFAVVTYRKQLEGLETFWETKLTGTTYVTSEKGKQVAISLGLLAEEDDLFTPYHSSTTLDKLQDNKFMLGYTASPRAYDVIQQGFVEGVESDVSKSYPLTQAVAQGFPNIDAIQDLYNQIHYTLSENIINGQHFGGIRFSKILEVEM